MVHNTHHSRSGFSLIEVAFATAIMGVLVVTVFTFFNHSDKVFDKNRAYQELEQKGLNLGEEIRNDLSKLSMESGSQWALVQDTSFTGLLVTGYDTDAQANTYGSTIIWQVEYSTDDPNNGDDDDNDGLVDEMNLVRLVDGVSTVKATNIQEDSFSLSESGNTVSFQFTLQKYVGKSQSTLNFTTTTRRFTMK